MEDRMIYPKSNFRYIVYICRCSGDGDDKKIQIVETKISTMSGKKYRESCIAAKRVPKLVYGKPEVFQMNEQYMLATRDVVWTWVEEE